MRRVCFAVICCLILPLSAISFETNYAKATVNKKCAIPNLKRALQDSSAVFVGKVLKVTKEGNEKIFEFEVAKYWKGVAAKKGGKIKISVLETPRFQAWFQEGENYLVFARQDEDGKLRDGRCSASKSLLDASEDIKQLGRAKIVRR